MRDSSASDVATRPVSTQVVSSLAGIGRAQWNALDIGDDPFLRHEYLHALELAGCAAPGSRWQPCHIVARDAGGALRGALPLYLKVDSWGEYVFDFAWASAYERAGLSYYPKLVSALPYTPVGGRRILTAPGADAAAVRAALIDAALRFARERKVSSWHILFCAEDELGALRERGLLVRQDCQFHWFNDGYASFDHYLETFRAARRKKTRRERRKVSDAGIVYRHLDGARMDAQQWAQFYRFYASSFLVRGREPYFPPSLFPQLAATLGERMFVKLALRDGQAVAGALFFHGGERLYGRYWGCSEYHDALHFETCYYQGIEHCIAHGLQRFDPGTQGEHKIARGFRASASWSAHWIAQPGFRRAIGEFLVAERRSVAAYMAQVDQHLPFRRDAGGTGG